ncbi:Uroporphyrinogen decarboxylase (URO-D) [Moorella glycerini]|uniref:Methylcobalamin:coenzyme M methyltransferase n=1 Tax=Neomoorella stamsii TaxID=1266720 RepID=A0A9X7P651_9FIRM|nr:MULTISPECIES: uroporphyrinogen decarboxylase family protein [Moorella]PRR72357.1 methylcobalamin:coenzyme M methyltransferase [Moorella stamsii]CEP67366.1 Uroporphyrinogen decarboxylase (URO-D) [Moorella glycerini]
MQTFIDKFIGLRNSSRNERLRIAQAPVTFHVGLGRSVWGRLLGFNLLDYFNDPKVALESQIKWKLFWHDEIPDDTIIEPIIGIDYGVALEPSLFGMQPVFMAESDPWYGDPGLANRSDLSRLKIPDFYHSGLMPRIHRDYEEMQKLTGGQVEIRFPGWARGPWSVACMLRGFTNLYLDLIDDPAFVHDLLAFITHSRKEWEKARCRFLGIDIKDTAYEWQYVVYRNVANSELFNDEVDGNLFSLDIYENFIYPYEKDLNDFYGGTRYYHSCGNLTPFLRRLKELKPRLMHISSATDIAEAHNIFNPETKFQCCMHPVNDVLIAPQEIMAEKIKAILEAAPGRKLEIWADALYEGDHDTLEKVLLWLQTARKVYQNII